MELSTAEILQNISKRKLTQQQLNIFIQQIQKPGRRPSLDEQTTSIEKLASRYRITVGYDDGKLGNTISETLKLIVNELGDKSGTLSPNYIPDILAFLVELARPPTQHTIEYASIVSWEHDHPEPPAPEFSWDRFIKEQPNEFTGDHWDAIREQETQNDEYATDDEVWILSSDGELSSLSSLDERPTPKKSQTRRKTIKHKLNKPVDLSIGLDDFNALRGNQYWHLKHVTYAKVTPERDFNRQELAVSFLSTDKSLSTIKSAFWTEVDFVREVLWSIQTSASPKLFTSSPISIAPHIPLLRHLSPTALRSLLTSFLPTLNALFVINSFIVKTRDAEFSPNNSLWGATVKAFGDAIQLYLKEYKEPFIDTEHQISHTTQSSPITLIRLSMLVQRNFAIISAAESAITELCFEDNEIRTFANVAKLVDLVQQNIELLPDSDVKERRVWRDIFFQITLPTWTAVGNWMLKGHLYHVDFFIHRDHDYELEDPEFFDLGFTFNEDNVSLFLKNVATRVLDCGRMAFLLDAMSQQSISCNLGTSWPDLLEVWDVEKANTRPKVGQNLELIRQFPTKRAPNDFAPQDDTFDNFLRTLSSKVGMLCRPFCIWTHDTFTDYIGDKLQITDHFNAVQGCFFLQRYESAVFLQRISQEMDQGGHWTDFHFLNTSWSDATETWEGGRLFRFRFPSSSDTTSRSVSVFRFLHVDYTVTWPLIYLFNKEELETYQSVFLLLLQTHRAKYLLDRMFMIRHSQVQKEVSASTLQQFYALKNLLSFFTRTLYTYFVRDVLGEKVTQFNQRKKGLEFQELLRLHREHLGSIKWGMFLNTESESLHKLILTLLDCCVILYGLWYDLHFPIAPEFNADMSLNWMEENTLSASQTYSLSIRWSSQRDDWAGKITEMREKTTRGLALFKRRVEEKTRNTKTSEAQNLLNALLVSL